MWRRNHINNSGVDSEQERIALGGEKKRVKGFLRNSGAEREKGMAGEEREHASVSWLSLI